MDVVTPIPDREAEILARLNEIATEERRLREELLQLQSGGVAGHVATIIISPTKAALRESVEFQDFISTVKNDGTWAVHCSDADRNTVQQYGRAPIPGFHPSSGYQAVDLKLKRDIGLQNGSKDKYLLFSSRVKRIHIEPIIILCEKDHKIHMVLQILEGGFARDEHGRQCQFCFECIFPNNKAEYILNQLKNDPKFMTTVIEELSPEVYSLMRDHVRDAGRQKTDTPRIKLPEKIHLLRWNGSAPLTKFSGGPFPIEL